MISSTMPLLSNALNHFISSDGSILEYNENDLISDSFYSLVEEDSITEMGLIVANNYGTSMIVSQTLTNIPICFCNSIDDGISKYGNNAKTDFGYAVGMSFRLKSDGFGCLYKTGLYLVYLVFMCVLFITYICLFVS